MTSEIELSLLLRFALSINKEDREIVMGNVCVWNNAKKEIIRGFDHRKYEELDSDGWNHVVRKCVPLAEKEATIKERLEKFVKEVKLQRARIKFKKESLEETKKLLRRIGIGTRDRSLTIQHMTEKNLHNFNELLSKRLDSRYFLFKSVYHLHKLSRTYKMFLRMMLCLQQYDSIDRGHLKAIFYRTTKRQRESFKTLAKKALKIEALKEFFSSEKQNIIREKIMSECDTYDA